MKRVLAILTFTVLVAYLGAGCGKKKEPAEDKAPERPPAPPAEAVQTAIDEQAAKLEAATKAAEEQAAKMKEEAEAVQKAAAEQAAKMKEEAEAVQKAAAEQAAKLQAEAERAKQAAAQEVARVQAEAETKLKAATAKFDATVAEIRKLIDGKNYATAVESVQKALNLPELTADQKKQLDTLMETAKQAMATDAANQVKGAFGNALKGFGK